MQVRSEERLTDDQRHILALYDRLPIEKQRQFLAFLENEKAPVPGQREQGARGVSTCADAPKPTAALAADAGR